MRKIIVELSERSYPIIIASGVLAELASLLKKMDFKRKLALITDTCVGSLYGKEVLASLQKAGFEVEYIEIEQGESSKQLSVYQSVVRRMAASGIDRSAAVIALGGGVVGDLAGFVAATYMRGVDFIQVPTTLLAQTDSSVGGKVGINLPEGKNLIGAFYQPKLVVIDPQVLRTLERRELFAGFGEVVKYALIRDRNLFEVLEKTEVFRAEEPKLDLLEEIIARCCEIKAEIVAKDEKEGGLRRILNFGHTPGHALEAVTGYDYFRHGEAVVWGMRAMSYLSLTENILLQENFERIDDLLKKIPVPPAPQEVNVSDLIQFMKVDKKRSDGKLPLVLLKNIGETIVVKNLPEEKIIDAMETIFKQEQN